MLDAAAEGGEGSEAGEWRRQARGGSHGSRGRKRKAVVLASPTEWSLFQRERGHARRRPCCCDQGCGVGLGRAVSAVPLLQLLGNAVKAGLLTDTRAACVPMLVPSSQ